MMCTSGATDYVADAYIFDADGQRIGCGGPIKALGVYFSPDLTLTVQVDKMCKRFRQRYWTLRNLKRNGFSEGELVQVYKTMIRPIAEYACVAFHSSYTDAQDERIERLQDHALKCIFGPGISARRMREMVGVLTLRARRIDIADKFAKKCVSSERMQHWFPTKNRRCSLRAGNREEYLEERARCKRLMDSPFFYLRRRLNGKNGKEYGKRNQEYREDLSNTN